MVVTEDHHDKNARRLRAAKRYECNLGRGMVLLMLLMIGFLAQTSMAFNGKKEKPIEVYTFHCMQASLATPSLSVHKHSSSASSHTPAKRRKMATTLRVTKMKVPEIDNAEQGEFQKVGLLKLYQVIQKQVDEEFATEVVENFDKTEQSTCVKGVTITLSQELLRKCLEFPEEVTGQPWTPPAAVDRRDGDRISA